MDIEKTINQSVAILSISGSLMGQPETHILFEHICEVLKKGEKRIIIDLKGVNWINSLGIGSIMKCLSFANDNRAELFLTGLNKKVKGIFDKTQLSKIFKIENHLNDAITKLKKIHV